MENAPQPRKLSFTKRARTLPHPESFLRALYWSSAVFILALLTLTSAVCFYLSPSSAGIPTLLVFGALTIICWVFAFFSRKKARCPLCKGSPLVDTGASPHQRAIRFFPLNYGTTNLIRSFFTRRFRCQFCGTPFDYLKPFTRGIG